MNNFVTTQTLELGSKLRGVPLFPSKYRHHKLKKCIIICHLFDITLSKSIRSKCLYYNIHKAIKISK